MDSRQLIDTLNSMALEVATHLFPGGRRKGSEYTVGSLGGEPGKSLSISVSGSKIGAWCDFATGQNGDMLGLWKAVKGLDTKEAMQDVAKWLGVDMDKPEVRRETITVKINAKPVEEKKYVLPDQNYQKITENKKVLSYITNERCIGAKTIEAYKLGAKNNYVYFPSFVGDVLTNDKSLCLDRDEKGKKIIYATKGTAQILFGWQAIPKDAKEVAITEGEIDALSLYELGVPALSVPGGAGGHKSWYELEKERLQRFDRIYVCMDSDEEGQKGAKQIAELIGPRASIVTLPCKDANEFLTSKDNDGDIYKYFRKAVISGIDGFHVLGDYWGDVYDYFFLGDIAQPGYEAMWPSLASNFKFRHNELTIWTGYNGHGKSQILGQIAIELMKQGAKVCVASLEMPPRILIARMIRQICGTKEPSVEQFQSARKQIEKKLFIYEKTRSFTAQNMLNMMGVVFKEFGTDVFIIDSLMKCGMEEDDYNSQKLFVEDLCDFKNANQCQVHLVVHPRKAKDEYVSPGKMDIKGTGAVSDLADNVFSVWRNKNKDGQKKHDSELTCYKQRNGDWEGVVKLDFDHKSYIYSEYIDVIPANFVDTN